MTTAALTALSWHTAVHHLLRSARAGEESLFLVGPPGTGKSEIVARHVAGDVDLTEQEKSRVVLDVLLGRAHAPAALLTAILGAARQPISARLRRKGTTYLLQHVADWLTKKNIGAVALDEVQHTSPDALFHAMLLVDTCQREYGHALGLVLIGTPNATTIVRETGQMGQRVPITFAVPLLGPDELVALCKARPRLAALLKEIGARRTEALLRLIVGKVAGSMRRLVQILSRAERLADLAGTRLTEAQVQVAVGMQED
ncbi:MAG: ATP-binding protein [Gemmatimonadaceae bacterium]|nr:ATP-binding protein [Gemmatimonadaceae bacterium]